MKLMLDSSVLIPAMLAQHPRHPVAEPCLARALEADNEYLLAAHSLAEVYSVLTSLPPRFGITPLEAWHLLVENLIEPSTVVELDHTDYIATLENLARMGLRGGITYDALIARAAQSAGVDVFLTLNPDDFLRVWPDGADTIRTPGQ
jgi:predicted nucleic acid-binding protein